MYEYKEGKLVRGARILGQDHNGCCSEVMFWVRLGLGECVYMKARDSLDGE